ncbi:MAG: hypothetical protein Q9169_005773 [Polycauliona sp. 2 TL-2023]
MLPHLLVLSLTPLLALTAPVDPHALKGTTTSSAPDPGVSSFTGSRLPKPVADAVPAPAIPSASVTDGLIKCLAAGGTYDAYLPYCDTNTPGPPVTLTTEEEKVAACSQAGGTWDAATQECGRRRATINSGPGECRAGGGRFDAVNSICDLPTQSTVTDSEATRCELNGGTFNAETATCDETPRLDP